MLGDRFRIRTSARAEVHVIVASATLTIEFFESAEANGTFSFAVFAACAKGFGSLHAFSTTSAGAPIASNVVDSPCG
jgi:hypothetical protein